MSDMGPVWMVARSEIRRRLRGAAVLTLLVGLAGGVVLVAVAGVRRTHSALTRFDESSLASTVGVNLGVPTPAELREFSQVPQVAAFAVGRVPAIQVAAAPNLVFVAPLDDALGTAIDRARVVRGRPANPLTADEISIGESLAASLRVDVGDHLDAASYTQQQVDSATSNASGNPGPPAGPQLHLLIVGIVRRPLDLGRRGALGGVVVLTPAFLREYSSSVGNFGTSLRIRTRDGGPDLAQIKTAALRIFGSSPPLVVQPAGDASGGTQSSIDVLVAALWIFAAGVTLAGVVAIGIVLTREIADNRFDQDIMRALGLSRVQCMATNGPRMLLIAVAGALVAAVGAVVASPLFPIGVARRAEPHLGIRIDWPVLAIGVAAIVAVVLGLAFVADLRNTGAADSGPVSSKERSVTALATRLSLPPSAMCGLRMVLERGRASRVVPLRSAFLGAVFGVFGVTAVALYTTSLHQLVTTPAQYGWNWDFASADNRQPDPSCNADDSGLLGESGIGAVAAVCFGRNSVRLDGHPMSGWGFTSLRGTIGPTVVAGRQPLGTHDVAVGAATMRALHKHIGDTVVVSGANGQQTDEIVGEVAFPTLEQLQPLASGAAFTTAGYAPFFDANNDGRFLLGRLQPGIDGSSVESRIAATPQLDPPLRPTIPVEIDRLRQIGWFPVTLGSVLVGLALIAVGHALVTAVRRRQHELAILTALGFERRQIRATIAWQATTLAIVGLIIGIPTGLLAGRIAWQLLANSLGVSSTPTIPTFTLLALAPSAVALVNIVAAFPARAATRIQPARELRSP